MKCRKVSILLNLIVVCVLLFSGVGMPGQGRAAFQPAVVQAAAALQVPTAMPAPLMVNQGLMRTATNPPSDSDAPDTSGAVGRFFYIQAVNTSVQIYNKSIVPLIQHNVTFNEFWYSANTQTDCDGERGFHHGQPTVLYDHMGQRFFIADLAYNNNNLQSGPYYFCIAVLNMTEAALKSEVMAAGTFPQDFFSGRAPQDPTVGPTGYWWFYTLKAQESWPYHLPGQPKWGLWGDGYYLAFDQYDVYNNGQNLTPAGSRVWAINRDDLNNGVPAYRARTSYMPEDMNYHGLIPATLEGNPPTAGTPEYFAAIAPPNRFYLFRFPVDWVFPDRAAFNQNPIILYMSQPYSGAVGYLVPQYATIEKLDLIGDRLTSFKYREVSQTSDPSVNGTNVTASLWAAHTVWNGSAGSLRWYEIRDPNTSPAFYQQGNFAPNGNTRWVSDLAVDEAGDMAIGYSVSGSGMYPSIRYTGRTYNYPLNMLINGEADLWLGTTYMNNGNAVADGAWGRHSAMSVDPVDPCVFWYTNEFYEYPDHVNWHTAIGWFRFPTCGGGTITRVSLSTSDVQGNGSSGLDFEAYSTAVSASGRFVAFSSDATNLVMPDANGKRDVFLRDRDADADGIFDEPGQVTTVRISNGYTGDQANGDSWQVSISLEGRFVAFSSDADNLVTGDSNGTRDVFLYDSLSNPHITRVSVGAGRLQGNGLSDQPAISGDGRYVAFRSYASNLVTGDTNRLADIFVRDTWPGGATTWVSVPVDTLHPANNGESYSPAISPDGRYVAFASRADNLDPISILLPPGSTFPDVFVRDLHPGGTKLPYTVLASVDMSGTMPGNGESSDPSITTTAADVRVAFVSRATNLTSGATNDPNEIFLRVMDFNLAGLAPNAVGATATMLVSNSYVGLWGNADSYAPAVSADGKFVTYASDSSNLDLQPEYNGVTDIFLKSLEIGLTQRISVASDGAESNGPSKDPAISADGGQVIFSSNATNLVAGDTNNLWDVFAYDRRGAIPNFLTIPTNIIGQPGAMITVPVNFTPGGQQIDSTSFSLDYDESCLSFTDAAGAVVFNTGASFNTQYNFSAADTDGEIDFSIWSKSSPSVPLSKGVLLTVRLTLKTACQAVNGTSRTARIGFSKDPQASFGRNGASIAARTTDGSVTVLAGIQGDCNSDGLLDAGDISALVKEIFDGDGNLPADAPKGSFPGSPVGCNPNTDFVIDAGDISCETQLLFGRTCSGGATAMEMLSAASTLSDPHLRLAGPASAFKGGPVYVPVHYTANGHAVNSLIFSVSYDRSKMVFDPTDANHDDIPDALHLTLPGGFQAAVIFQPAQAGNQIGVAVFNPTNPSAVLPDGILGAFTFRVSQNAASGQTRIAFGDNPAVSFGEGGQSPKGSYEDSPTEITDPLRFFIPFAYKLGQ